MAEVTIDQAIAIADRHHRAGELAQAADIYAKIVQASPGHAEALHRLGILAYQQGRHADAMGLIRQSLAIRPNFAPALNNLALVLMAMGQGDQALAAASAAVAADPAQIESLHTLGNILYQARKFEQAEKLFRDALARKEDFIRSRTDLAQLLIQTGRAEEAVTLMRRGLELSPDHPDFLLVLGNGLRFSGHLDKALEIYTRLVELCPNLPPALNNRGFALYDFGRFDEAEAMLRKAIAVSPNFPDPHGNLSLILLLKGQFEQGWREYRWRPAVNATGPVLHLRVPEWDGSRFDGKTLLLRRDQGAGDTVLSMRFVPQVAKLGGKVVIECNQNLTRLLSAMPILKEATLIEPIAPEKVPQMKIDLQVAQMNLPQVMGVNSPEEIPAPVPYIEIDPAWRAKWQDLANEPADRLKVGIAWAGAPQHLRDSSRSMPLSEFAPLAGLPVKFFNLQIGAAATAQLKSPPAGLEITDLTDRVTDFADTAALIEQLDLVITVDTSVAHIAGAMNHRTWLLLPKVPDYRWLLDRSDSPWYPSLRLFRQETLGDWTGVMARVAEALRELTQR